MSTDVVLAAKTISVLVFFLFLVFQLVIYLWKALTMVNVSSDKYS